MLLVFVKESKESPMTGQRYMPTWVCKHGCSTSPLGNLGNEERLSRNQYKRRIESEENRKVLIPPTLTIPSSLWLPLQLGTRTTMFRPTRRWQWKPQASQGQNSTPHTWCMGQPSLHFVTFITYHNIYYMVPIITSFLIQNKWYRKA